MMKKTIAILLAMLLILTAVPFTGAFAAEDKGAIYVNNPDADGSGTDLMTFLNDDKSNSAAATGGAAQDYGLGQTCADGNILHCFNWTLSQIKEELPNIAAAGFTSVQTSPLQAHDGRNQWYWLYQPNGFTIGNELGSYSDLQALCTEADKYGVKVIVDVVANHLAGSNNGTLANSVEAEFKNNKATYFHNKGACNDWDNREDVIMKNIGMPDLNSENTAVQNKVITMVNQLKSAGVDGIRWDAAKHIGLPSENCTFWSNMAQIDLYQYGEILGNPAGDSGTTVNKNLINEYAQYIGVTDSGYSGDITKAIKNNVTLKTVGNWGRQGVAGDRIVYWGESHDTYANDGDDGWTKNLDQNLIDKAYAILGSRADSQALYLSRPSEKNKTSIYYGKKGSTHFTSKEVAEVNRFHNLMVGTEEKYISSTSYKAVLRGGGAVLVSHSANVDLSVNNTNAMVPAGTYTDKVSGATFTVTDTKITGHVGSTGIAVFYQTDQPAHVHTPAPAVRENEVSASCTAQGSYDEVIYCTSCGEEISRTPKTVSALGHSLQYVEEIPATPIADGTRAHYVCTRCGKLFADANGAAELSRQDLVLKAEYILGDADGDGSVTILDATFIQRALVGIVLPSPCDEKAADVDGDGDMTIMDVTYIQRALVGIDVPYAIGDTLQLRD